MYVQAKLNIPKLKKRKESTSKTVVFVCFDIRADDSDVLTCFCPRYAY